MESKVATKVKEALPEKKERKRVSCGALVGGFLLGLLVLFLLAAAGIAAAISASGLVEVPVLSNLFKPPAVTEEFSYKEVSEKQLENKLRTIEGAEGKVNVTLTGDEVNTLISDLLFSSGTSDMPVKELLVKFSPGVIKVKGSLVQNDAPFYLEIALAKSADSFEFDVKNSRLGALPIPGALVEGLVEQLLGTEALLGQPSAESVPVNEITVKDGSITIKGLDLSGLGGPQE